MQVKICGLIHPDDAYQAAIAGADYIGVIFSPLSKRIATIRQACEIKSAIDHMPTKLVGVFVDESVEEIEAICTYIDISLIQLHAKKSESELERLIQNYSIFYAVTKHHSYCESDFTSERVIPLFDNDKSGKSKPFAWFSFVPPKKPWILAGGLTVNNVVQAIHLLNPFMVDVASGVEQNNSLRKDSQLMQQFIKQAKTRTNHE